MSIEVTMRHSDVRIEALKEYAEKRMGILKEKFPKVTKVSVVIDVDAKKHMYMAEVVANRLGETAVGAKEFSPSGKQRTTVYYCHPYCSSERGSNENQNGFIRRFIPKGTAISRYTPGEIREIQDFINYYPRGIFNYKNAATLFEAELQKLGIQKNSIFF